MRKMRKIICFRLQKLFKNKITNLKYNDNVQFNGWSWKSNFPDFCYNFLCY